MWLDITSWVMYAIAALTIEGGREVVCTHVVSIAGRVQRGGVQWGRTSGRGERVCNWGWCTFGIMYIGNDVHWANVYMGWCTSGTKGRKCHSPSGSFKLVLHLTVYITRYVYHPPTPIVHHPQCKPHPTRAAECRSVRRQPGDAAAPGANNHLAIINPI